MPWLDDMQAMSGAINETPRQQIASIAPPMPRGATEPSEPIISPMDQIHTLVRELANKVKRGEMTEEQLQAIVAQRLGPRDDPQYVRKHSPSAQINPQIPHDPYDLFNTLKAQRWGGMR